MQTSIRPATLALLLVGWLLTACSEHSSTDPTPTTPVIPTAPTVASVTLSASYARLLVPDTLRIAVLIRDSRGQTVDRRLTWSSTSPSIVAVDADGLVTAVAAGTAEIVATVDGVNGRYFLTVSSVGAVKITATTPTVSIGATLQLAVSVVDNTGVALAQLPVTWTALDTVRATVSSSGTARGVGAGTGRIVASVRGRSDTLSLAVLSAGFVLDTIRLASDVSATTRGRIAAVLSLVDSVKLFGSEVRLVGIPDAPVLAINTAGEVLYLGDGVAGAGDLGARSTALTVLMSFFPIANRPSVSDQTLRTRLTSHASFNALVSAINADAEQGRSFALSATTLATLPGIVADVSLGLRASSINRDQPSALAAPFPKLDVTVDDAPTGATLKITNNMFLGFGVRAFRASNLAPIASNTFLPRRSFDPFVPNLSSPTRTLGFPIDILINGADDEVVVELGTHPDANADHCAAGISWVLNAVTTPLNLGTLSTNTAALVVGEVQSVYACGTSPTAVGLISGSIQAVLASPGTLASISTKVIEDRFGKGLNIFTAVKISRTLFSVFNVLSRVATFVNLVKDIPFIYQWMTYGGETSQLVVCQRKR